MVFAKSTFQLCRSQVLKIKLLHRLRFSLSLSLSQKKKKKVDEARDTKVSTVVAYLAASHRGIEPASVFRLNVYGPGAQPSVLPSAGYSCHGYGSRKVCLLPITVVTVTEVESK